MPSSSARAQVAEASAPVGADDAVVVRETLEPGAVDDGTDPACGPLQPVTATVAIVHAARPARVRMRTPASCHGVIDLRAGKALTGPCQPDEHA